MTDKIQKINFPQVIAMHVQKPKENQTILPFGTPNQDVIDTIVNAALKGVVKKDGSWHINPGFIIEKPQIGVYKIYHNLGYKNTSLSVTILVSPGTINVLEHAPTYFIVETSIDKVPTDLDFAFTLIKVI